MNRLVCATAALAAIASPAVAAAQSSADAESLFREARALVKAGRVAEGCDAFESSQRIEPTVPTLLNLADCRERNQQLASAWGHFVAAAQQTRGDRAQAASLATAQRRAAALEPRLSYLVVAVPDDSRVDGLVVSRNGVALDPGMWNRSLPVDGGDYVVEGKAPGHEPWSTRVTVAAANDRRSVEVPRFKALPALSPVAPPAAAIAPARATGGDHAEAERAPPPLLTGRRWVAVGVAGLGAASLVTAAVLGAQARAAEDDAFVLCPDGVCTRAADAATARTLHDRAQDRALIANLGFGVAAAAAAVAGTLWWLGAGDDETRRDLAITPVTGAVTGAALEGGSDVRALFLVPLCVACVVPDATFVVGEEPPGALTIEARMPAADALDVGRDTAITIRFSAAVDPRTVSASTVAVVDDLGAAVPADLAVDGGEVVLRPSAPLRRLRSYRVTIDAAVAGTTGQHLDQDVTWTFATRDGTWAASVEVSHGEGTEAFEPHLGFHHLGYAFAAWRERDPSVQPLRYAVWTSLYTPVGGWSNPLALSALDLSDVSAVSLAVGSIDDAVVGWNQGDLAGRRQVAARRYRGQMGWRPVDVLAEGLSGRDDQIIVSTAAGTTSLAMWADASGVVARRARTGDDGWEAAVQVAEAVAGPVRGVQVQVDASGDAVAVWQRTNSDRVVSRRYRAEERWMASASDVHDAGAAQYQPRVVLDGAGNATAIWLQVVDGRERVVVADQARDGAWTQPVRVDDDASAGATAPRLAVAADGAVLAVWNQYDAGRSNLWGRYRDAAGVWGPPTAIEGDSEWESAPASVAFDGDGRALAVWTQASGMLSRLWSRRFVPGAGWQPAIEVAPTDLHAAGDAVVAFDPDGAAIVMWRAFDGLQYRIRASRFE